MEIKFCSRPRCHQVAVKGYRSDSECRTHYVDSVQSELVQCEVTGPRSRITGVDRVDVDTGGTVWLDPAETNLAALVYGGHIRIVEEPEPEPAEEG